LGNAIRLSSRGITSVQTHVFCVLNADFENLERERFSLERSDHLRSKKGKKKTGK
jgi:hypothetical protein